MLAATIKHFSEFAKKCAQTESSQASSTGGHGRSDTSAFEEEKEEEQAGAGRSRGHRPWKCGRGGGGGANSFSSMESYGLKRDDDALRLSSAGSSACGGGGLALLSCDAHLSCDELDSSSSSAQKQNIRWNQTII